MIPELTARVGTPLLAAIEHPFGLTFGKPGDVDRQNAVLRGALRLVAEITQPGAVVYLPFAWDSSEKVNTAPPRMPPITRYLARHPWQVPKFLNRDPPEKTD